MERRISYLHGYRFFVFWSLFGILVVENNDYCFNESVFHSVYDNKFYDNITTDIPIFEYSDLLNGSLSIRDRSVVCINNLKLEGTKLYVTSNLKNSCGIKSLVCQISCGVVNSDLILDRVFIPNGLLYFNKKVYTVNVTENTSPNTIYDFSEQINLTDCYQSVSSGRLYIKNNDSGPFEVFDKRVILEQGHILDYDSGKISYDIEISFKDDVREALTLLVVNVEDVDDVHTVFVYNKRDDLLPWQITVGFLIVIIIIGGSIVTIVIIKLWHRLPDNKSNHDIYMFPVEDNISNQNEIHTYSSLEDTERVHRQHTASRDSNLSNVSKTSSGSSTAIDKRTQLTEIHINKIVRGLSDTSETYEIVN